MKGPQGGCTPACPRVRCLPEEQEEDEPSRRIIAASSHIGGEMGVYFDGLHHKLPMVQGKDCIFVVIDQLTKYTFFRHTRTLHSSASGRAVLQRGLQATWSS